MIRSGRKSVRDKDMLNLVSAMLRFSMVEDSPIYVFKMASQTDIHPLLKDELQRFLQWTRRSEDVEKVVNQMIANVRNQIFTQLCLGTLNIVKYKGSMRDMLKRLEYESYNVTKIVGRIETQLTTDRAMLLFITLTLFVTSVYQNMIVPEKFGLINIVSTLLGLSACTVSVIILKFSSQVNLN